MMGVKLRGTGGHSGQLEVVAAKEVPLVTWLGSWHFET
jgi:hypothetical protein